MSDRTFEIVTEACANLPLDLTKKYGINYLPMVNLINGTTESVNTGVITEEDAKSFYNMMRNKTSINTACVSEADAIKTFVPLLKAGKDVLYAGFSSGLSASYEVVVKTLELLKIEFPERKILNVDLLAAAAGHALLINYAAEKREKGETIEQVHADLQKNKRNMYSFYTVENLSYLYKGGRLKKTSYLLASTLNIKPVMTVDPEGRLTAIGKVFGRKMSINALVNQTVANITDSERQTVFISHGDCLNDAEDYILKLKEKINVKGFRTEVLDLVIGAHAGPGCLAVFFFGKERHDSK